MAYFSQIDSYKTYEGQDADFHYDYNGNSGGGQSFLGGQFLLNGGLTSPAALNGMTAAFSVSYRDQDGLCHSVNLDTDERYMYLITPRGQGSQNMKLGLQDKIRPSLLLPAFLMLPSTCGINMAGSLEVSPLVKNNYWLRSMRLDCSLDGSSLFLVPKDFVFGGGRKKGPDGKPVGDASFFKLDFEKRINDVIRLADSAVGLDTDIVNQIDYFGNLYRGHIAFEYDIANANINRLMAATAQQFPTLYSGYGDPLPTLMAFALGNETMSSPEMHPRPIRAPRNLIFFGAPGTGKSYQLNRLAHDSFDDSRIRRVTFYPDYTYSQFVGSFKPVTRYADPKDDEPTIKEKPYISYEFVPGPFLSTYISAVQNPGENYLLIVEEINRANPAAVFGDVFQLLDRNSSGHSEYGVAVPKEMEDYLHVFLPEYATSAFINGPTALLAEQERLANEERRLSLPPNMYIWATMNSADQGVFPMDTAFKRRWDFRYMGIDEGDHKPMDAYDGRSVDDFMVGVGDRRVRWNALRKALNSLMRKAGINEDKLLGPFFLSPSALSDDPAAVDSGQSVFVSAFKDKVLLYLYEDAGKMRRDRIFAKDGATYSELCRLFDDEGVGVFDLKEDDLEGVFVDSASDDADGE